MARKSLEEQLARLQSLRDTAGTPEARSELLDALRKGVNHVAGKAASVIAEAGVPDATAALVSAFDRFMADPLKTDKGCAAKTAIALALHQLHAPADEVYLRGVTHVQLEPVFGGKADTAAELRGVCALALVDMNHPEAMALVVPLLVDPERQVRIAAARALAATGRDDAALVLDLKIHVGDNDPEVLSECLGAILSLWRDRALPLVTRLLDHGDGTTREVALLTLGASRLPAALPILRERFERNVEGEFRRVALLAVAMLRSEEATAFLLEQVREGSSRAVDHAITALATFRHDAHLRRRVADAVEARGDSAAAALFRERFGG